MSAPTDEEYAAAVERDRAASKAYREHLEEGEPLLSELRDATQDLLRVTALRRDLRELILDEMRTLVTRRPWTVKRLAKLSYRSEAVVQRAVFVMVEAGLLRKVSGGYEAAAE